MKRQFAIGLLGGIIGAAVLFGPMSRAGSVGAHSRSDLASAPPSSHTASISAPSLSLAANPAISATLVCGTISTNTTWLLANSPYEVCSGGVTISPTATLTIQPGVTVQFANSATNQLHVRGALSAIGTLAQPITFTGVVATPGSWGGLDANNTAIAPALVNLEYVTLHYGGVSGSTGAQLYADRALVTITHSLIRNGGSHGVYVAFNNPQVNLHDTSFISNTRNAIQLDQPKSDILMSGLSASGNGVNAVFIQGSTEMNDRRRWTFTGIPYVINGPVTVVAGGALSIEPGSELQFTANGRLAILGEFKAIGLPNAPITLTGQIKTPGAWEGLIVSGAVVDQAIAQLDYVTIEYGGSATAGANIVVGFGGQLVARHSLIRFSSKDGVRLASGNASVSVLNSQIVGNTLYGVHTTPFFASTSAILATNNWWGDANGPTTDVAACSSGHGDRVTSGVLFRPVLTSTNLNAEFPLSDAPILTLTPRRWFAPADGTTKVYFDITLRDGNGAPLPGRAVNLSTSLGTATSGGITDLNGKTLAYLVSNSVGDANVKASLAAPAACEAALSPKSKVTFSTPVNITNLFPDSPASYFDGDISVTPLPVVVGITTTIHAKLTNPLPEPITVDVSFGFAQSGIGLAFGPIKDIVGQVIPANSSVTLAAPFVPIVSGHYCVQVSYNITAVGSARLLTSQAGGSAQSQRLNLNAYGGSMGSPGGKDSLNKADKSFNLVSKLTPKPLKIQKAILGRWWGWAKDSAKSISKALGGDPPRQDYNQTTLPVWHTWPPVQPGANVSTTRAAAMNAASTALADVNAYGTAATVALDRYGGASEAHNLEWAALQANARLDYEKKMAEALLTYADNLEAFVQVLVNEGETNVTITASDVISYQQRLATSGLTTQEIADARLIGLTDAEIEEYRLGVIAANPNDISGNVLTFYTGEAAISRRLGNVLLNPSIYAPGLSVSGGRGGAKAATAGGNTLAQIYENVSAVQLANPLTQTATIDVRARRVGLPADWMVSVSPAQAVLAPGEQTTVTVRIVPGSPTPQGSIPRVAIEGYAGSELLGGIAVEVVVP
ncbi:MAG: Ig-like domain-containing protein, partial [Chloroflexota bacterium]|nr:Ig-like domain-containing protein [Chloroflexota bacterium]